MSNYKTNKKIGEGTYGKVFRSEHIKTKRLCAIKKIPSNKEEGWTFTTIREIKVLKKLSHRNIIQLLDIEIDDFELSLIMEFLPFDLAALVFNDYRFSDNQIKSITYQILDATNYLHNLGLIHRDIKTNNILLDKEGNAKLADFGLTKKSSAMMTNRVCTLWYRAPELLLGSHEYCNKVDMWSIGCCILEMKLGKVAFKGINEIDQVVKVFSLLGPPKEKYKWSYMFNLERFESKLRWDELLFKAFGKNFDSNFLNYIGEFLELSPIKRISAREAMHADIVYIYREKRYAIDHMEAHDFNARENARKYSRN
ncbi:CMGC/CDK protein kinase [Edhazardia aedis USNM 41457]|uniref:CMGC/CDK protein kinase n=1 Tax=Edhazardia aedis (strain USNM 41457) TaxID=1003232 RepID=J9DI46_EDHAE|nr:CMGC/CDK protein kinase [Edhazardia aedis USNM 41457]|eukprot:EJW02300.1 CMGC/CDK protein kinase [Edhazardia aedis USNM 41457]